MGNINLEMNLRTYFRLNDGTELCFRHAVEHAQNGFNIETVTEEDDDSFWSTRCHCCMNDINAPKGLPEDVQELQIKLAEAHKVNEDLTRRNETLRNKVLSLENQLISAKKSLSSATVDLADTKRKLARFKLKHDVENNSEYDARS